MFIVCPKCAAKYKIPEGIQLESGQKLKCSACDFVFMKGEEAPLILDEAFIPSQDSEAESSTQGPFSKPLYTAQELKSSPADSLPEAFQPVAEPPKKKRGIILALLYVVLVVVLCAMGWMFRDSLKPSFQTNFSSFMPDESKIPPKIRQNALPVRPKKVQPAFQPVVEVSKLSQLDAPKRETGGQPTPSKKVDAMEIKRPLAPMKVEKDLPVPTDKNAIPTPVSDLSLEQERKVSPTAQSEIVAPDMNLAGQNDWNMPEPITLNEPDVVPLFEVLDTPVPAGTPAELSVTGITFKVEPTEDGLGQVLIEGQIQNNVSEPRSVPVLTVVAVNKEGQRLIQKKVHTATDSVGGGEQIPFYTSLSPVPDTLDHIEVEF
ncbi:MAG: zinc-ribbon domain-containing protein [Pseudomonadota bacterium]|nr:zinc-ribbon domain-containing protein [Pseudomonadota bacterium]